MDPTRRLSSDMPDAAPAIANRTPGLLACAWAFVVAVLVSLLFQFAALGKVMGPNPNVYLFKAGQVGLFKDGLLLDYAAAGAQFVFVLLLMAWHRRRFVWPMVAFAFAALAGYSLYWTLRGEKCGCFGKLWEPKPGVSVAIDVGMAVLAILVSLGLRTGRGAIAAVLVLSLAFGGVGYYAAKELAPPKRTETVGMKGEDRLLASDLLKDVREQPAGGPRWYLFIHDPDCHLCEQLKPMIEMFEQQYGETDPNLRIRKLTTGEVKEKTGIETFEWNPTPTALLIKDGAVEKVWRGEQVPIPDPEFVIKAMSGQW